MLSSVIVTVGILLGVFGAFSSVLGGGIMGGRPAPLPAQGVLPGPTPGQPSLVGSVEAEQLPIFLQGQGAPAPGDPGHLVLDLPPSTPISWSWHFLPKGLVFPAYLAGGRESRFGAQWVYVEDLGWTLDSTLGAHLGLIRFGTHDPIYPEGFQIDVEGAAFPRLAMGYERDLVAVDFRIGIPLSYRHGRFETKLACYHLCSHLGDEWLIRYPALNRINFARDALVLAVAVRPVPAVRLYAEAGWAFLTEGGSEPWEFQFGVDLSPVGPTGRWFTPFLAVNTRLRQEVDFSGNFTAQAGLQWSGPSGGLLRFGAHYFNGLTDYYEFFREHEEQIGLGMWYDF